MPSTKPKTPDLSVVIPAYREAKRIGLTLDSLNKFIKNDKFFRTKTIEVIVVVADSADGTVEIVKKKAKKFRNFILLQPGPRAGKGRDVRFGMLKASGSKVVFMDADLATPLRHLKSFYELCNVDSSVVIATRNILKYRKNVFRYVLSNIGNLLFRIAGGMWIEDSQCGFKMFTKKAAKTCFSKLTILGWGFDMEILAIARANNLPIQSVRINDWRHKAGGTFDDSLIKNGLHSLVDLMKILYKRITKRYQFKR